MLHARLELRKYKLRHATKRTITNLKINILQK